MARSRLSKVEKQERDTHSDFVKATGIIVSRLKAVESDTSSLMAEPRPSDVQASLDDLQSCVNEVAFDLQEGFTFIPRC